jgi:cytochrome c oxidase subunit 3
MSETSPALHEPWPNMERQREGVSFGMWVFLASEVLFFGGLFLGYTVYRNLYPEAFRTAAQETEAAFGAVNTAILMTSSLTMAVASRGARAGFRRMTQWCLVATASLGALFLISKGFEYRDDILNGMIPGPNFPLHPAETQIFWAYYWVMTGLHAIHVTIGVGIISFVAARLFRGRLPIQGSTFEGVALYWHLVDAIWIVLLPLLYLVGRA